MWVYDGERYVHFGDPVPTIEWSMNTWHAKVQPCVPIYNSNRGFPPPNVSMQSPPPMVHSNVVGVPVCNGYGYHGIAAMDMQSTQSDMFHVHGHGQHVDMQQTAEQKAWHILGQPPTMGTLKVVDVCKMKAMTMSCPTSKCSSFGSRLPSALLTRNVLPVLATKVNSASMGLHSTSGCLDVEQASGQRVHVEPGVHTPIVQEDGLQVSMHHTPHHVHTFTPALT